MQINLKIKQLKVTLAEGDLIQFIDLTWPDLVWPRSLSRLIRLNDPETERERINQIDSSAFKNMLCISL